MIPLLRRTLATIGLVLLLPVQTGAQTTTELNNSQHHNPTTDNCSQCFTILVGPGGEAGTSIGYKVTQEKPGIPMNSDGNYKVKVTVTKVSGQACAPRSIVCIHLSPITNPEVKVNVPVGGGEVEVDGKLVEQHGRYWKLVAVCDDGGEFHEYFTLGEGCAACSAQ